MLVEYCVWCWLENKYGQALQIRLWSSGMRRYIFYLGTVLDLMYVKTCREVKQIHGHSGWITCLLYASGNVWSGSSDKTIRLWNAKVPYLSFFRSNGFKNGNLIKVVQGHIGWIWCLQAVGFQVWSGSSDKTIRIWQSEVRSIRIFIMSLI